MRQTRPVNTRIVDVVKKMKEYLSSATPEELEEDRKEIEKLNKVGPTCSEYFKLLENDKRREKGIL